MSDAQGEGRWLRMECGKGDLIVLPAGIYHRFVVDDKRFFHVKRLFVGDPVWTPHNRDLSETEERDSRKEYKTKVLSAQSESESNANVGEKRKETTDEENTKKSKESE